METNCIFCKIAKGEIPAEKLFENEELVAFKDIHPAAPTHFLIIPKRHLSTLNDATPSDEALLGRMLLAAKDISKRLEIAEGGYRTLINVNRGAGQVVFHLHMHVLGGRPLGTMG